MSFINFSKKEISFKIVYYGPALCGKTTNVEQIHRTIASQDKGELTMLSTQQDRTLFFDFLPLKSDIIKGFSSKFQIYTVPGQVIYNETRRLVLRNVDGIVFVADSQWSKMQENAESYANLEDNLQKQGMTLDKVPYILQFNKRDLPEVAPAHYLDFMLNRRAVRAPSLEAVARESRGVMESLNLIAKMVLSQFIESNKMQQNREMPSEVVSRKDG
jgi:signal recognition particle receptor subunit beta